MVATRWKPRAARGVTRCSAQTLAVAVTRFTRTRSARGTNRRKVALCSGRQRVSVAAGTDFERRVADHGRVIAGDAMKRSVARVATEAMSNPVVSIVESKV